MLNTFAILESILPPTVFSTCLMSLNRQDCTTVTSGQRWRAEGNKKGNDCLYQLYFREKHLKGVHWAGKMPKWVRDHFLLAKD